MTRSFFVTGTDTGVGKTLVTAALLRRLRDAGAAVAGMKPVAAGTTGGPEGRANADALLLQAESSVRHPYAIVNPWLFEPAVAPHIAARQAGVTISLERIERGFRGLAERAQVVVVEGVGGFQVPLGPGIDTAQLAARLALPVVLVVGMRLGCLNHALLTAQAVAGRGLPLAGWVANHVDPQMSAAEENVRALEERLAAPLIARIAHAAHPEPRAVAALIEVAKLG